MASAEGVVNSSPAKVATLPCSARRQAAARVRRARCALGHTQAQAAALAGISERSYRDIELGRVRMAALEALCVLEDATPSRRAA